MPFYLDAVDVDAFLMGEIKDFLDVLGVFGKDVFIQVSLLSWRIIRGC